VFSSPHDGRLVSNYRAAVKRVRHAAGIYFIPHDLRRLAATAMERCGVPVYTIKAVLNHATSGDVTAQCVQLGTDMKLAAMERIERFVLGHHETRLLPMQGPQVDQPGEGSSMPLALAGNGVRIAYTVQTEVPGREGAFLLRNLVPQEAANAYTVPTQSGQVTRGSR